MDVDEVDASRDGRGFEFDSRYTCTVPSGKFVEPALVRV